MDMTHICEKCHKVAPINYEASNSNWIVYDVKKPCECGGKFKARFLVLDEEADHEVIGNIHDNPELLEGGCW